jgi:rare lipoprotein A (peptidoglycan hydrolase)
MSRTLQGVAHKTLPCGTRVSLLYRGRRLTVPVVDRGPYAAGKHWDLTAATAAALRFTHTDRVGAIRAQSK